MDKIKERIYSSTPFRSFVLPDIDGPVCQLQGFTGSLRALFFSYLFERYKRSLIFLTSDDDSAERVRDDLELIAGKECVAFFPVIEMTPYSERAVNPSLLRLRLESLQKLLERDQTMVVTSAKALSQPVARADSFVQHQLYLKNGAQVHFDTLVKQLSTAGYERCDTVEDVGHFAVRGGIIDIYPWTSDDPVRIEFFGDQIESIRSFNIISQRSIESIPAVEILPLLPENGGDACLLDYLNGNTIIVIEDQKIILRKELELGADICKIIGTALSFRDNLTYLSFLNDNQDANLICFGMGEEGKMSRIFSPLFGGVFTYASSGEESQSASGQIALSGLKEIYRVLGV